MTRRRPSLLVVVVAAACFSDVDPSGGESSSSGGEGSSSGSASTGGGEAGSATSAVSTLLTSTGDSSSDESGEPGSSSSTSGVLSPCDGDARRAYLNFDGATLVFGNEDDPIGGVVDVNSDSGDFPPYSEPDRAEIFDLVTAHFAPFDLCITEERPPPSIAYDMVVITELEGAGPNAFWTITADCDDEQGPNLTVLKVTQPEGLTAHLIAAGVSRALASTYGLELLAEPVAVDLMGGSPGAGAEFTDQCWGRGPGYTCATRCSEAASQNSFQVLLDVLGPA